MPQSKARMRVPMQLGQIVDYNIQGCTTGRISCSQPNLSNPPKPRLSIPFRTVTSPLFTKSSFVAQPYPPLKSEPADKNRFWRRRKPEESRRGLHMDSFGNPDQLAPYFDRPCDYCNDHTLMQWLTDNRYQAMMDEFHRRTRGLYRLHAHPGVTKVDFPRCNENGFFVVHTITSRNGIFYAVGIATRLLQFPVMPCLTNAS